MTVAQKSLSSLANALVTPAQLVQFRTRITDDTVSQNFAQSILTNTAGVLLRLPQELIAAALVLLQRYQILSQQSNFAASKFDIKTISAAVIYTTAKLSFTPLGPRSIVNVYAYLTSNSSPLWIVNSSGPPVEADPRSYFVTEGTYEREKIQLFAAETHVLATLGFDTHVVLPYVLALTYIQTLGVSSPELAGRVIEHLNGGLSSPQYIYLTHQPNALAVAAIYLAAREIGVKLVEENWWEVFDVDREDLGFLFLAFGSLSNFANSETVKARDSMMKILPSS